MTAPILSLPLSDVEFKTAIFKIADDIVETTEFPISLVISYDDYNADKMVKLTNVLKGLTEFKSLANSNHQLSDKIKIINRNKLNELPITTTNGIVITIVVDLINNSFIHVTARCDDLGDTINRTLRALVTRYVSMIVLEEQTQLAIYRKAILERKTAHVELQDRSQKDLLLGIENSIKELIDITKSKENNNPNVLDPYKKIDYIKREIKASIKLVKSGRMSIDEAFEHLGNL